MFGFFPFQLPIKKPKNITRVHTEIRKRHQQNRPTTEKFVEFDVVSYQHHISSTYRVACVCSNFTMCIE